MVTPDDGETIWDSSIALDGDDEPGDDGRIEEVMAAVKKRRDAEIAQSNGNDVPGEGVCETILRRAVDQTMQDIPQVRQGMNRPLLLISRPLLLISRPFLTLTHKCMTRRKAELRYASVRRSLLP